MQHLLLMTYIGTSDPGVHNVTSSSKDKDGATLGGSLLHQLLLCVCAFVTLSYSLQVLLFGEKAATFSSLMPNYFWV